MLSLLRKFGILYEPIDAAGRIMPGHPAFWEYLRIPYPEGPAPLVDVFPEIAGCEADVDLILSSGGGQLLLKAVYRDERYFNLSVVADIPDLPAGIRGLVTMQDDTQSILDKQRLMQDRNEIGLLTRKLEARNIELSAANSRLDDLMRTLRTHNLDLETKVRIRTRELHDSRLSVITTLAHAAEFRDTDTGGHINRIGHACALIAGKHGLAAAERETLFYASLLHDVGKIGIPDSVLLKPGPLTRGEWVIMREHTRIGADLMDRDDHLLFSAAREVALHHHEKWNGAGYPDRIAGEAIPIMSRICAVADVFDALTSERPYKHAWSEDQAVDFIVKESGISFDPSIVHSFLAVLDGILALRKETSDLEPPPLEFD
jgi:response regulator RpfG family c-di-GMP phosphodiesterase